MRQLVGTNNWSDSVAEVPPLHAVFDSTANDSDKSWTVPGNEMWHLNWVHVLFASTSTVGNRILTLQVKDGSGNIMMDFVAGAVQAASATVHYAFLQGIYRETTVVNSELQVPMAQDLYLDSGYVLRIYDSAAVAVAADDMTVSFQAKRYVV